MLNNLTKDITLNNTSTQEFFLIIQELLKNDTVKKMKNFNQHANTSTYQHCVQVAYYTYTICKKLNLDYVSATRGAMLHDLFLYDWHFYNKPDKKWKSQHAFMHPKIALKNATKLFDLNEIEKDVILNHMWPVTIKFPHYTETLIVTIVDKFSACKETFSYLIHILQSKNFYRYSYIFLSLIIFRIV